jgi:signal transduction histidine kinase
MMRLLDSGATPACDQILRSQVDVGVAIRTVVSELESMFDRRGIAITWTSDTTLPCVDGDPDLLHRALLNILINAADAMAAAGAITITTCTEAADAADGTVRIDVADTGAGIAPELMSRVFDPGFSTKPSGQPRGFGLGISRRIAQLHGGRIDLSSVPGHGTTVSFTLPIHHEVPDVEVAPVTCAV